MADTLLYTVGLGVIDAANVQVTPPGGAQGPLSNFLNGGTLIQAGSYGSITPAGSNLATAPVIANQITQLGTAASTTGVALPASASSLGALLLILNQGSAAVHVYGQGSDTIDSIAGTTGVTITNGHRSFFTALSSGAFISGPSGTIAS